MFITSEQNIRYRENLAGCWIAISEFSYNSIRRIGTAASLIQSTIATMKPDEFRKLDIP